MSDRRQVPLRSGRALSAVVSGEGPATVVFLAGFMAGASEWSAVQRQLPPHAKTISYDRAGYGESSDPASCPTGEASLTDLVDLLDALEVHHAAVFVAHSWGGTLLRLLAREHPERVAAACLIDTTRAELISTSQTRAQSIGLRLLGPLGIHRLAVTKTLAAKLTGLEKDERAAFLADSTSQRTVRIGIRESAAMAAGDVTLLAELERQGLPGIPVTFLVGGQVDAGAKKTRSRMLAGHEQEAAAHPQGRFVVAADSGHMVPQQQPDLVAREVLDLISGVPHA